MRWRSGLRTKKVNWVLDADIRDFFDTIDHGWLVKFVEHRIADRRVVRLIQKWLNAGVLEDGKRTDTEEGTPQGGSHLSAAWRTSTSTTCSTCGSSVAATQATGDVIVVRYADDFVVGFQNEAEAKRFWADLAERFAKFGLELHPEKTRLSSFGRRAAARGRRNGRGKPETFDFLGFTHICGRRGREGFSCCGGRLASGCRRSSAR